MSDETFEMFDVRDTPDGWFDVIQREGSEFLEKTSIYPTELVVILIQVIFQNFIYSCLSKENRETFLKLVFDTFLQQFKEWDEQDSEEEGSSGDIE